MRRSLMLLLVLLLGATTLAAAQEGQPPAPPEADAEPITATGPALFGPITGAWSPVELESVDSPFAAPGATLSLPGDSPQDHGSDFCETAPTLQLVNGTGGDILTVNDFTESASDPVLSCMYGFPQNPRGFRTAWYRFTAPASGLLRVYTDFEPTTFLDSYDTVLALYRSSDQTCGSLVQIGCSDDSFGFFSELSYFVIEGRTYYIEVADWQFAQEQASTLRLAIVLAEGESFWESEGMMALGRSRHMVVSDGAYLYIIGGEVAVNPFPNRDGKVTRFDPSTGTWTELYPMPNDSDNLGYSRTSAVYLSGRIYVPSGYTGNNNQYDGDHWVYEIATDSWFRTTPAPWPDNTPYAWAQAVASPSNNGYFLTGGLVSGDPDPSYPSDAVPTGRLFFFAPSDDGRSGFWNTNLPDMSRARYAHVAAMLSTPQGQKVCVSGGLSKSAGDPNQAVVLRNAECYSVSGGAWTPIASPNFARFSAGSAVGPDGRWYVFGGVNSQLQPVTLTEVYDPATDTWTVLDSRYSLRNPGRAWPRGDFVDGTLWVFGGETVPGQEVIPLVESLFVPAHQLSLPLVLKSGSMPEPNDTFAKAVPLQLWQPQWHDFAGQDDYFDVFRFYAPEPGVYQVIVSSIPNGSNYDVYLYSANKFPVGSGTVVGSQDEVAETLVITPGVYYAMVLRAVGPATSDSYQILARPAP